MSQNPIVFAKRLPLVMLYGFGDMKQCGKRGGKAAKALVRSTYLWSSKAAFYAELHSKAVTLQKESSPQR